MAVAARYLAGDIGGTNARLVLVTVRDNDCVFTEEKAERRSYPTQRSPGLVSIVKQYLKDIAFDGEIDVACFAVAGLVMPNNTATLPNLIKRENLDQPEKDEWYLDGDRMARELGLKRLMLINDFVANAYGVLLLPDNQLHAISEPSVRKAPQGVKAVIGAGSGLGKCFLTPFRGRPGGSSATDFDVWPTEGGHVDASPRSQLDLDFIQFIRESREINTVSSERVVSGRGISDYYAFFRERHPDWVNPKVDREYEAVEDDQRGIVVSKHANKATPDKLCDRAMAQFIRAYGSEAGNFAISTLCFGGLYIAGGIAPNNLDRMQHGGFMDAFMDKGRQRHIIMDKIPVYVIMNQTVGTLGARVGARKALRGLDKDVGEDVAVLRSEVSES